MDKMFLNHGNCIKAARAIASWWKDTQGEKLLKVYGVPRGGIPVAYMVAGALVHSYISEDPRDANLIVDDLVDSGRTRDRYSKLYPTIPFLVLKDHLDIKVPKGVWIVFPWEQGERDTSADDIVVRLLEYIGEDPARGGLKETPGRVLKAWKEWCSGYNVEPDGLLKCFEDGSENYDEMVVVKNLPFYSHCEHHLAPFFGTATIAYIPERKIVGLSKLGRVLSAFSKRLQVQERLTTQIADAIQQSLQPKGVGVLIKARHMCMESRGMATQGHCTVTSALRGKFLEDAKVRGEFLAIAS